MRLTEMNHQWLQSTLQEGDIVVDATLGNGHDALFLAQHIGASGQLFGFDVQLQAITQSRERLSRKPCYQALYHTGHENLASTLPLSTKGNIKAIMFNLGWLPHSDKSIITHANTTLLALQQSLTWLAVGGKLSAMVYPGHQGGDSEATQVIDWLAQVCQGSSSALCFERIDVANRPTAPVLLKVKKLLAYSCDFGINHHQAAT